MSSQILGAIEPKMTRAVEILARDLQGIRTGRASTALVERIHVEYYGTSTALNQLAGISVPEPHQIVIQPWDRSVLGAIEKAILKSDLGLTPNVDGTAVRLNIPQLTEERRRDIVKVVHRRMEEARVEIRNLRRHDDRALSIRVRDATIALKALRAVVEPVMGYCTSKQRDAFFDLLFISPRRVYALARLAIKESIRRRVVVVFAVFILILLAVHLLEIPHALRVLRGRPISRPYLMLFTFLFGFLWWLPVERGILPP
jgi:ribosome recycling factor